MSRHGGREALFQIAMAKSIVNGVGSCMLLYVVQFANPYRLKIIVACFETSLSREDLQQT